LEETRSHEAGLEYLSFILLINELETIKRINLRTRSGPN